MMLDKKFLLLVCFGIFLISFIFATITIDTPTTGQIISGVFNFSITTNVDQTINCTFATTADGNFSIITNSSDNQTSFSTENNTALLTDASSTTLIVYCVNLTNDIETQTALFTIDNSYPNVTINTPENITYANDSITFNVTTADTGYVDTCLYSLNNGVTNYTMTNATADEWIATNATMAQGAQNVTFYCNDSLNNLNNTESVIFFIDSIYPQLDYGAVTQADNTTTNLYNWTYVNISLTEIHNDTITFVLYNSTSLVNTTLFTGGAASTKYINWTGLMDDTYTYYVTVNDSAGNSNTTANRTIMLDHVSPVPTITSSSATQTSLTLTITADGGVSGTNSSCRLELRADSASISGTGATQTLTESSLACGNSYTYQVSCNDRAGNSGTSATASFSTSACGDGGGYSGGSGSAYTWKNTYVATKEQFKAGYTNQIKVQNRIKVQVGNSYHYVGVKELTANTATIEIASDPVEVILNIGEDAKVDVDNDDVYDIYVKLLGIENNEANVFVQEISEEVPEELQGEKVETTGEVVTDGEPEVISEPEKKDLTLLWVLIIVLVLAAIIGGGIAVKKRK